jgi:cellulose binding protein with CBM3 domain
MERLVHLISTPALSRAQKQARNGAHALELRAITPAQSSSEIALASIGQASILNEQSMRNMRPKAIFMCSASAALLLGGGLWGCVAGVDVSDEEFDTISQQVGSAGTGSSTGGTASSSTGGTGSSALGGSSSSAQGGTGSSTGGTSSGAQGGTGSSTGGTGGNPNAPPPAVGDCADEDGSGNFEVSVTSRERPADNQISVVIGVDNVGNGFPLSDLVLRYWFNDDDLPMDQFDIDYTSAPGGVTITFGEALGSNFADIGFSSTNDIGTGVEQIQIRLRTSNYATVNQTNDFSYNAGETEVVNRNISAYKSGAKIFGCEPGSE